MRTSRHPRHRECDRSVSVLPGCSIVRILLLGAAGMLGHKMHEILGRDHEVVSTVRSPLSGLPVDPAPFLLAGRVIERVDVADMRQLDELLREIAPEAVINCVGVIKQREAAHDPVTAISINALFPHQLAAICEAQGARLIHFSTDCVFSGTDGDYTEASFPDATDLYGRTKYLGEVTDGRALTIRSSIIGRELSHFGSLVEWFLSQQGEIRGFTRAIYTGVTTIEMARIVATLLDERPDLAGLYQIASAKISKYELVVKMRDAFGRASEVDVVPYEDFASDRSLRGDRFLEATGITVSSWDEMLEQLSADASRYRRVTT